MTTKTTDSKVTAGAIVSATVKYTNFDDASRTFNISAEVNIQDKKVTNFNSGSISKKDSTDYNNANFSAGKGLNYFSFNSNNLSAEDVKEAIIATLGFIADVEENVDSAKVEE